jgi:hypothetical protein
MPSGTSNDNQQPTLNVTHHREGSIEKITDDCSALGLTKISRNHGSIRFGIPNGYSLVDDGRIISNVEPYTFNGTIGFLHNKGTVPCMTGGDASTGTVIIRHNPSKTVTKLSQMTVKSTAVGGGLEDLEIYSPSNKGKSTRERKERGLRLLGLEPTEGEWSSRMRCWNATVGNVPRECVEIDRPVGEDQEERSAPQNENTFSYPEDRTSGPPTYMSSAHTTSANAAYNAASNTSFTHNTPAIRGPSWNFNPAYVSVNEQPSFAPPTERAFFYSEGGTPRPPTNMSSLHTTSHHAAYNPASNPSHTNAASIGGRYPTSNPPDVSVNAQPSFATPIEPAVFYHESGTLSPPTNVSSACTTSHDAAYNAALNPSLTDAATIGGRNPTSNPPDVSVDGGSSFANSVHASADYEPEFQRKRTRNVWGVDEP